jgi:Xaa-Pro dipeptidase
MEAHLILPGSFRCSLFPASAALNTTFKKGDIVLMDCGCKCRAIVQISQGQSYLAEPTKRQLDVWNLEHKSQAAGFAAARIGVPCEQVDAAARKVITDAGFGPGYQLPGLPHRTGHGIGMDGHEWGNMVKGNQQLLQTGMCFSIEPTISIPGEFGVRMEDCIYMTEAGPKWFSNTCPFNSCTIWNLRNYLSEFVSILEAPSSASSPAREGIRKNYKGYE